VVLLAVPAAGAAAQIVRGQVVDSVAGTPISHANVILVQESGAPQGNTVTDPDGLFQIQAARAGTYRLRVEREGYRASLFPQFSVEADQVQSFVLLVAPLGLDPHHDVIPLEQLCERGAVRDGEGALYGVVSDGTTGMRLAGVDVVLSWPSAATHLVGTGLLPDEAVRLVTDTSGRYVACGLPDDRRITVHARTTDRLSDLATVRFDEAGVHLSDDRRVPDRRAWRHDLQLLPMVDSTAGTITGAVVAAETDNPVRGAVIDVPMLGSTARSDANGRFVMADLPGGALSVIVRQTGFRPMRREVLLERGSTLELSPIRLDNAPVELSPIVVEGRATTRRPLDDFWRRRERGFGDHLTRAEFMEMGNPQTTVDVLQRMQGVRIRRNANYGKPLQNVNPRKQGRDDRLWVVSTTRAGPRSIALATYECPPLVFVDRAYMGDPWRVSIEEVVSLFDVEAVEVYNGISNVPPELSRPGSECGAIVFWTR
jgi:hypothetical protein